MTLTAIAELIARQTKAADLGLRTEALKALLQDAAPPDPPKAAAPARRAA